MCGSDSEVRYGPLGTRAVTKQQIKQAIEQVAAAMTELLDLPGLRAQAREPERVPPLDDVVEFYWDRGEKRIAFVDIGYIEKCCDQDSCIAGAKVESLARAVLTLHGFKLQPQEKPLWFFEDGCASDEIIVHGRFTLDHAESLVSKLVGVARTHRDTEIDPYRMSIYGGKAFDVNDLKKRISTAMDKAGEEARRQGSL